MPIFIGIDIGTSGCRACAIDGNRKILSICSQPLPPPDSRGNAVEQDATLWWQAVAQLLAELCSRIDPQQVRAIAIDGTSGTLLVTDDQGRPLAPALMYNDSRAIDQASRISQVAPENSAAHGASSGLAKLMYLQQQYPDARHALHQADWLAGQLCGRFDISDENNALKTGYDPAQGHWPEWLNKLNIDYRLLPEVVPPGTPIGRITQKISQQFGLAESTQVVAGTTDSIAAFIATGASKPGESVTSLGSTLVVKIICEQPVFSRDYGIYSHKLGKYWLAGGASNSGGAVLKQFFSDQQLREISALLNPAKQTGLDYYPLCKTGERFPQNNPELMPRLEPRPEDDVLFFQAILEGISRIEHKGYQKLQQLGAPYPTSILTAGGGSGNAAWTRIRQQIIGVNITTAEQTEACVGSALLAMQAL